MTRCPECNGRLEHIEGNDWVCADCGLAIWMEYDENDVEWEDDEEEDVELNDKPDCCIACGGPYPNCTTSCPLFDE